MDQNNIDREEYDSFIIPPATTTTATEDTEDDSGPIQVIDAEGKRQLIGYAVVWGATSSVRRDGFKHRFAKGAITWQRPTAALWHHDYSTPLASTSNSTMSIVEDEHGAKVTIDLDGTTDGQNAFERVKNRLVSGMSFGGRRLAYDRTNDPKIINVTSFIADECSITLLPAMTETNIFTADKSDDLKKFAQENKESQMRMQKDHLSRIKLAQFKPLFSAERSRNIGMK